MKRIDHIIERAKDRRTKLSFLPTLREFLKRVEALNPLLLSNFSPFLPANYSWNYHLETQNEELIQLVAGVEIDSVTGEVSLSLDADQSLYISAFGEDYLPEIKTFLKKLNASGIVCLQVMGLDAPQNHYRILVPNTETCNCKRCLWDRFELDRLLEEMDAHEAFHKYPKTDQLPREAYVNYLMGQVDHAFYWLEQVIDREEIVLIQKAIAEHNMKALETSIKGLSATKKKNILPTIEKLDLYKRIAEYRSESLERHFLSDVHEQRFLLKMEWDLNRQLREIKETHRIYANQGTRVSAHHVKLLEEALVLTYLFYHQNCLFDIRHNRFRRMAYKLWEGLLLSYTTNEAYEYRLKEFRWFHLEMAIRNLGAKELTDLFKENGLLNEKEKSSLSMGEEQYQKFLSNAQNFFSSNHLPKEELLLGNGPIANPLFESELSKNLRFNSEIERYSQNFLLFLAHVEVPTSQKHRFSEVIDVIHDFVEIENPRSYHFTFEYLADLLTYQYDSLSKPQIDRHISILLHHRLPDEKPFRRAMKDLTKKKYKIDSKSIWRRIRHLFELGERRQLAPIDLLNLYPLLPLDWQEAFREYLTEAIESPIEHRDWDYDLYQAAIEKMILHPAQKELFTKFLEYCQRFLVNIERSLIFEADGIKFQNNFQPFNLSRAFVRIVRQYKLTKEDYGHVIDFEVLPAVIKWMLHPEEFDAVHFDPKWLYLFEYGDPRKYFAVNSIPNEQKQKIEKFLVTSYQANLAMIYFSILGGIDSD